jgi:chromosome partitioning protein
MQGKVISTINIKGGVGKTTTIGCLAELLDELNKKVLIVDMDPQANISQLFCRYETGSKNINDIMMLKGSECIKDNVKKSIQKTDFGSIDIIASNEELSFVAQSITFDQSRAQQVILKKALSTIIDDYDYILIDNTPFFNILTINSLVASDYVITPVSSNGFSYAGLTRLLSEIYRIKDEFNPDLVFLGAFITNANKQKRVFKDLFEEYKEELGDKFLHSYIRTDKNVDESNTAFVPLLSYNRNCNAVADYRRLLASLKILNAEDQKKLESIIKED